MEQHEIPARDRRIRELISEVHDKTGIHLDYDDLLIAEYIMLDQLIREAEQHLEAAEKSFIERFLQYNEACERRQREQLARFSAERQAELGTLRLLVLSVTVIILISAIGLAITVARFGGLL